MDFKNKYLKYKEKYLSLKNNLDLNKQIGGNKFKKGDFVNFLFDPTKTLIGIVTEKLPDDIYFVITQHNIDELTTASAKPVGIEQHVLLKTNYKINGFVVSMEPSIMVRGLYKESDLIQQNIAEVAASKEQYDKIEQMMKNLDIDNDVVPPPPVLARPPPLGLVRPPPGLARPPPGLGRPPGF